MKRILIYAGLALLAMLLVLGCRKISQPAITSYIDKDTVDFKVIADTITYDVIIKNTVKIDPITDGFLRYLDKTSLIDGIFESIYAQKLTAYDYFTKEKLSLTEIKVIENAEGFSRDAIGKIQFAEVWYYNAEHSIFKKKIISMVLGLEQFNSDGTLRGYTPVFKIYMN